MDETKLVWLAVFITSISRGNVTMDAATQADKGLDEYLERFETDEDEDLQAMR